MEAIVSSNILIYIEELFVSTTHFPWDQNKTATIQMCGFTLHLSLKFLTVTHQTPAFREWSRTREQVSNPLTRFIES